MVCHPIEIEMFQSLHDLTPVWAYLLPFYFYLHYSKYPGLLSVPHRPILYLGSLHLAFLFLKHLHGWLPHFFQASAHLLLFREIFPTVFSNVSQFLSQPLIFSPPTPAFFLNSTYVLVIFFVSSSVNSLSDLFCKFYASRGWFLWLAFSGFCFPSVIGYDWPLGVLADQRVEKVIDPGVYYPLLPLCLEFVLAMMPLLWVLSGGTLPTAQVLTLF